MLPPLPKETWGAVVVIGFRVGLAFLLGPGSLDWSPLRTPMAAVPLLPSPAFVPITANTGVTLGSCSEAGWAEGASWGKLLAFIGR